MFSGIVEGTGSLRQAGGGRIYVRCPESWAGELRRGQSVSVSGVCLTAARLTDDGFGADVSAQTAACTTLGGLREGETVNLERALLYSGRIDGHFVSGHVDTVGTVDEIIQSGDAWRMQIAFDEKFSRLAAGKGSAAVNGVSLTVNEAALGSFSVTLVPYTLENSNLACCAPAAQ